MCKNTKKTKKITNNGAVNSCCAYVRMCNNTKKQQKQPTMGQGNDCCCVCHMMMMTDVQHCCKARTARQCWYFLIGAAVCDRPAMILVWYYVYGMAWHTAVTRRWCDGMIFVCMIYMMWSRHSLSRRWCDGMILACMIHMIWYIYIMWSRHTLSWRWFDGMIFACMIHMIWCIYIMWSRYTLSRMWWLWYLYEWYHTCVTWHTSFRMWWYDMIWCLLVWYDMIGETYVHPMWH